MGVGEDPSPCKRKDVAVTAIQDMEVKLRAMRNMLEEGDRWGGV